MQNSYLRLETDPATGKRHPLLAGLEDAPRIINGVRRVEVEATTALPQPAPDPHPVLSRPADGEGLSARDENQTCLRFSSANWSGGRVVYFPWDIDRTFWEVLSRGSLQAVAQCGRLGHERGGRPLPSWVRASLMSPFGDRRNRSPFTWSTSLIPMMMKGPVRELIPLGEQKVRLRLPEGVTVKQVRLLAADKKVRADRTGGHLDVPCHPFSTTKYGGGFVRIRTPNQCWTARPAVISSSGLRWRQAFWPLVPSSWLSAEAVPAANAGGPPWYRRTLRWGQTNITEIDPTRYDVAWWRTYWKRTHTQGVIVNAGGIVAYYPSGVPLHRPAQHLNGRDLFGELCRAAHEDGLTVLARMDSNRAHEEFHRAHPDWFAVDAEGRPPTGPAISISPASTGPITKSTSRRSCGRSSSSYHPEGFTDNSWSGLGRGTSATARTARNDFAERTGKDNSLG